MSQPDLPTPASSAAPPQPHLTATALIDLFAKESAQVNQRWTFFCLIALGLLSFAYKELAIPDLWIARLLLGIGFIVFAIGNNMALTRAQRVVYAAVTHLKTLADPNDLQFEKTARSFNPTPPRLVLWFQASLAVVIAISIFVAGPNRPFSKAEDEPKPAAPTQQVPTQP